MSTYMSHAGRPRHPVASAMRLTFQLLVGMALLGALAGALFIAFQPDMHILWCDDDLSGPEGVLLAAIGGAFAALVLALVIGIVVTVVGVVIPAILLIVLVVGAVALLAVVLSALGGIAAACTPFLLLGFACVLLWRALTRRRPRHMHPNAQTYR